MIFFTFSRMKVLMFRSVEVINGGTSLPNRAYSENSSGRIRRSNSLWPDISSSFEEEGWHQIWQNRGWCNLALTINVVSLQVLPVLLCSGFGRGEVSQGLTFLDLEVIQKLEDDMNKPGYVPNTAQRCLVEQVTCFVHGKEGLSEPLKATEALRPGAETKLDWKTIEGIAEDVPSCTLGFDQVVNLSLVDLSVSAGLFDSKSAALRLLKQGGLYLYNSRVNSESKIVEDEDIVDGKVLLLSAGKKNKVVVRIS